RAGGDVYHASSLLLSAKDTFKKGGLSDNRALLDDLQKEAKGLLEKEVAKAKKHLLEVQGYVVDVKNLGANVADAEGEIKLAFEFIERDDHLKCTEHANMAREVAEDSRERRIGEIEIAIPETQILVEEAKDLGSDVKEAGKLLEQAKVALKKKDYLLTNELTKRAQQKTAEVQNTQIQKAMELRQRQMENISKSISKVEPLIKEAEVYGLDVVDVSDMLQRAKLALEYQDYVNGTFYIKNAGELVKKLEPELHKFRKGSEVRRPKGDICTRCKSTNLKFFANGWGKCISCGNIFKWKATARTEKKKKGLFNRLFKGDQDS
ncbi:MAG: hypothetical protein KAI64_01470, partial [Thermoplasmata archaeon]|nr:hypothetical protein [Thermoplasmata archaeon]